MRTTYKFIIIKIRSDGVCSKHVYKKALKSSTLTLFNHGNVSNLLILDNIKYEVIVILMSILNVCVYCHTVHMYIL